MLVSAEPSSKAWLCFLSCITFYFPGSKCIAAFLKKKSKKPLSFPCSYHYFLLNSPTRVKWSSPSEVWAFPPSHPSLPEPAPAAPVWIDCSLGLLHRGQPQFSVDRDSRGSLLFSSLLDSLFSSSNVLFLFGLFFFFTIASPEKGLLGDKFAVTLHVWKCMSSLSHWLIAVCSAMLGPI